jgi:hypothetical protein
MRNGVDVVNRETFRALAFTAAALSSAPAITSEGAVVILPGTIDLTGPTARQRMIVELKDALGFTGEEVKPELESSNPMVAAVENGFVVAKGDGKTTITAKTKSGRSTAEVVVRGVNNPQGWSFRNHVQSVLTKQGCNSGACHGAIAGKNGFRLSLRGFDADGDYAVLAKQANGRRIDLGDPGQSLILLKATASVTHGGGERLKPGSRDFNVLADWIAHGAPSPNADDPTVESVEIFPASVRLQPGAKQQFVVRAKWTNGRIEDVTHWTKYTATNAEAAQVDDDGNATCMGYGEGAVVAWYQNKLAVATVTAPYPKPQPSKAIAAGGFIDRLVDEKLQSLGIPASPACTDGEFIRRASLDTIGVLPTAEEVKTFLADTSPDKRSKLIDHLLDRPEFVDYWAYRWSDLLLVNSEKLTPAAAWSYYGWIRRHVAAGTPWDGIVRDLLTAKGEALENGAVNFYMLHKEPTELVETISTAFMGMPLNCCRCHNHPMEKWTNDEYYGFLNLVARVKHKNGDKEGGGTVFVSSSGDIVQPRSGKVLPPKPLDGKPLAIDDPSDRRAAMADWLVSPTNPYFTRSITNRVWANFMGVGLVEKVDDLRLTNPASNEALLSALAKHLADNRYDLKSLMKTIMTSSAYQRSSVPLPGNKDDRRFYSRYYPKRLMAEVLLDAASQVTKAPTAFPNYPAGWRALQLPDSNVASYFLDKFGRPDRVITCDCERTSEPSVVQVLHLSNGDALNKKLSAKDNAIDAALKSKKPIEAVVEDLYLSALARKPSPENVAAVTKLFNETPEAERRKLLEDVYWGVLSSKEFLFNH